MTNEYPIPPDAEDANQAAFRLVQEATSQPEKDDRCTNVWNGKRCKLRAGHFEAHLFDL